MNADESLEQGGTECESRREAGFKLLALIQLGLLMHRYASFVDYRVKPSRECSSRIIDSILLP